MLYYDYDDNKETPQNPILIIKAPTLRFRLSDFRGRRSWELGLRSPFRFGVSGLYLHPQNQKKHKTPEP